MLVHLVDGTYELFRHYYAVPPVTNAHGEEVGAVAGVVRSIVGLLESGATHVAVATDHVIESFRNDLYPGYKSSAGMDPVLLGQFVPLEEALVAMGVTVWPMVEWEADDALAAGAARASSAGPVEQVLICTPDKDLAQCVRDARVVQLDRRQRIVRDEDGVRAKFGVGPRSIPDLLALTGDSADGFPGLPGWGAKSAAAVLGRYEHLEAIPARASDWDVSVRGAERLAATLAEQMAEALLYRDLATLREDTPVTGEVQDWRWTGPGEEFGAWCDRLADAELRARVEGMAARV
ncbi:MAG TPA: 5'-3' exonuclease H3TH domain-containing protein [Actinomycetota bacterium]